MASTSQISKSLHSGNRRSSRVLLMLFLGGTAITLIPGIYLAAKDIPQMGLSTLFAHGSSQFFPTINSLASSLKLPGLPASTGGASASRVESPAAKTVAKADSTTYQVRIVDQAVATLNAQLDKDPRNPTLHNRLGMIYAELGEMDDAEAQFRQAVLLAKTSVQELTASIDGAKQNGNLDQASKDTLALSAMRLELSSAHSNLARVFEKLGDNRKVVSQLDELNRDVTIGGGMGQAATLKASGPKPEVLHGLARAGALMQVGRNSEAIRELNTVISVEPNLLVAHETIAKAAISTGNLILAQQSLERSVKLEPKAENYATLGSVYQQRGKTKEAAHAYLSALALNPKDATSAFHLGNVYAGQSLNAKAADAYKRAIGIDPRMAAAHNNLGTIYSTSGQFQKALEQFEKAIALAPGMGSAHYGLGIAMYNQKNYLEAGKEFKQALVLDPGLLDAQNKIQLCYRKAGNQR